jgi:DNA invertase Pin-like site-specific DNA recombinase
VVYKVDRLTRALSDFAKLVDELDAHDCSFVSVTQAFNTSTSMGRLTLNVLLSFAQFEREVTAERIRDKLAASKAKGLWMGGKVPMGYDADGRTLKINKAEAKIVEYIFELYLKEACVNDLMSKLREEGIKTKRHIFKNRKTSGGQAFERGGLHYMLRNPIYIGKIRHKDKVYDGQHDAVISMKLWEKVQEKLDGASARKGQRNKDTETSPLAGKLFDDHAKPLTPSHTKKGLRRYRYYISKHIVTGDKGAASRSKYRIPAHGLEEQVVKAIVRYLKQKSPMALLINNVTIETIEQMQLKQQVWTKSLPPNEKLLNCIDRIEIRKGELNIRLQGGETAKLFNITSEDLDEEALKFITPFTLKKRGVETKLIMGEEKTGFDPLLMKTLYDALQWKKAILEGVGITELAKKEGLHARHIRNRIQMAFLSPRIMKSIAAGMQPTHLNTEAFVRTDIPLEWSEQEKLFGFS